MPENLENYFKDICSPVLYQTGRLIECRYFEGCAEGGEQPSTLAEALNHKDTILTFRKGDGMRRVVAVGGDGHESEVWRVCEQRIHGLLIDAGYSCRILVGDTYQWQPKATEGNEKA